MALAVVLATLARGMAQALALGVGGLPKFPLSPVMCAVLLGMLWRNSLGVPGWATRGLDWTMHRLLRVGIALVGLRLTLAGDRCGPDLFAAGQRSRGARRGERGQTAA